jgi:hypothetical protein
MTPIIAGRFEQETQAQHAIELLRQRGFAEDGVTTFFVNPPGQHAAYPIGGDREASPGATHAHSGAIKGAAVGTAVGLGVGLVAAPVLGPAAAVVAASAGAYAGSLAGALGGTEDRPKGGEVEPQAESLAPQATAEAVKPVRHGGLVVAARAPEYANRVLAVKTLRAAGARDIERAEGTWENGAWVDFDPLKPPRLVDLPEPEESAVRG